ncbi:MON2 -like protein [Brachionus plicatilis]|uniref:MON2-like protein n=1 Tax=Brachionus plicatilis TaxID=10195 RepID=A0A3M7R844_BRAPC|nr:MON2 -like protein [Brachionus plicatilis]
MTALLKGKLIKKSKEFKSQVQVILSHRYPYKEFPKVCRAFAEFTIDKVNFRTKNKNPPKLALGVVPFVSPKKIQFKTNLYISFPQLILNSSSIFPFPTFLLGKVEEKKESRNKLNLIFNKPEMSFILKERICPLLIKLFSPSTKLKPSSNANSPTASPQTPAQNQHDQKNFVIVSRLIRIVYVLVKNYFDLLITESEIFLSLLTKFLENERPLWQKALSIEVFHKISTEASLIEQLVLNYDMKQQTNGEKLFHIIISSISQFIQSLFLSSSPNQQTVASSSASSSSNNQQFSYQISSAQPSFIYKDTTLQLLYPYTSGQVKSLYLEGSDRADIPGFPDGYLLSIGFSTLQEMCKSIQSLIEKHLNELLNSSNGIPLKRINLEPSLHSDFCTQLMSSSASSLLSVYNLLLDTSLDETITEHVLKSIKLLVHLSAVLNMDCERDWFVTCICKSALPHNYIGQVLNVQLLNKASSYRSEQADKQCQIVAVGAPLAQNAPAQLYITAKNLLTIKSILNMSNLYAELLGSSWYIVLNTLEHLTWTLALKPMSGSNGALKHLSTVHTSENSMIFTAVQTDIAFICNLLSKLFESTRLISDQALDDVINSLLRLSIERFDLAYVKTEPCLFAISKLYETVISNLSRLDLFWHKVTAHFLSGCKHSNVRYREWCVDSVCNLIRATFNYKYTSSTSESDKIERDTVLRPLHQLSTIQFNDVRQKQIECTLSLLRLMGQHLDESWPVCLDIVGAIQKEHTDILVRSAFQCLQLVVTDFLSMINARHLSLVVNVVAKFGSQEQDLNISLTAIVLLWNISDYMFQKSDDLSNHLAAHLTQTESLESIWMVLFSRYAIFFF